MPENSSNFKLFHYFYQMIMNTIVHLIVKITVMINVGGVIRLKKYCLLSWTERKKET